MSDVGKEQKKITAGLDLGDKYSYLCLLATDSGEECRLRLYRMLLQFES
jgi:hypothetical protein